MSDSYSNSGQMHDLQPSPSQAQKAHQACLSCRKQKRKCDKALPACTLCARMNRRCDYSSASAPPSNEEFTTLQYKVMELESKLNGSRAPSQPDSTSAAYSAGTPATSVFSDQQMLEHQVNTFLTPPADPWIGIKNRFPAIAFLDSEAFGLGGVKVPAPTLNVPVDVLRLLEEGLNLPDVVGLYFATVHKWMPIVSLKKLHRWFANPSWEAGPDMACLFLTMKLLVSRPPDGSEILQTPIYQSAKRFISLLEASGTASLAVLQANILVSWYEYGHAIYPAAYMSAGWCVRYGSFLGINNYDQALQLLPRPVTWVEQEERRRTWWGVLLIDRLVTVGSQGHVLNNQEPDGNTLLPVDDQAWDEGEMGRGGYKSVASPMNENFSPFPRVCQASILIGKILSHHHGPPINSETAKFGIATQLYIDVRNLARKIDEEAAASKDFLVFASPLALSYTALCLLCEMYSCPEKDCNVTKTSLSPEAVEMQLLSIDGLKTVSRSIVEFADKIVEATSTPESMDRLSPMILDALYCAASTYAWLVRESGDEESQKALDRLRNCLKKLGTKWRSAAEYLRILEAQEFTYTVGSAR